MYLFWAFQNEIWNEVAMKLRFSRIAEQRKCSISFVTSGNLAGKREAVHFVPNPWDFWRKWNLGSDLQWIPHWTHLCGAFGRLWRKRTWIDWGRSCLRWIVSTGAEICSDKFMFKFVWNIVRIEVVMMMTFLQWNWHDFMKVYLTKILLRKFTMALVFMFWKCSHMYICIFWHNFAGDMGMFSKRTAGGWVDYDMGQDQGGQNSFDVEKGTFFAR